MPMIFRLEVAFDHHHRLERNLSVMATATHLWLCLEVLDLVQSLRAVFTRMKRVRLYASARVLLLYAMITRAVRLLEISRVLCPTKLPGPFSNTSAVRATAILGHWRR